MNNALEPHYPNQVGDITLVHVTKGFQYIKVYLIQFILPSENLDDMRQVWIMQKSG